MPATCAYGVPIIPIMRRLSSFFLNRSFSVNRTFNRPVIFLALKTANIVGESVDYLLKNRGPDENGRAHPTRHRLRAIDLCEALALAKKKGLNPRWQVYHFPNTFGMWDKPANRDAVILKKFDQVLQKKYGGNLIRMLQNTSNEELMHTPLLEVIDGKPAAVNLVMIYNSPEIGWSAFQFVRRALALKIENETNPKKQKILVRVLQELKPEHMARSCRNTWDRRTKDRVLMAKFEMVLNGKKYQEDIVKMVLNTATKELLLTPLMETVAGKKVRVKMGPVYQDARVKTSVFRFIQRYLALKIPLERCRKKRTLLKTIQRELRPEHLAEASKHTWNKSTIARVLVAKVKSVMQDLGIRDAKKLPGTKNLAKMLFSPLIETVAGAPATISMGNVRASPFVAKNVDKALRYFFQLQNR